jgi:hypothetical protein
MHGALLRVVLPSTDHPDYVRVADISQEPTGTIRATPFNGQVGTSETPVEVCARRNSAVHSCRLMLVFAITTRGPALCASRGYWLNIFSSNF